MSGSQDLTLCRSSFAGRPEGAAHVSECRYVDMSVCINLPPSCSWRGSAQCLKGFAPLFTEPTLLRLVMLPIDSCLYRISMLMFCLVPLAVRCSKVFAQTPPGKREGPAALPCSSLTAWECLTEGMAPPGLPSTSSGSPQTQEVTF